MPTGAGDGSWVEGVRCRAAVGALTCLSVIEVSKRRLLELAFVAGVRECFGALWLEYRHIKVSIRSVGGAYWSCQWQLGEGLRWRTADGALTPANVI